MEKDDAWLILPSTTPAQSDGASETRGHREEKSVDVPHVNIENELHVKNKRQATPVKSIVWTSIAALAAVFLVLALAILIAHCLAWFIVYKTEARLGEARRGLVRGGEMRLCLCARG
jgi:hypothetical protein